MPAASFCGFTRNQLIRMAALVLHLILQSRCLHGISGRIVKKRQVITGVEQRSESRGNSSGRR